MKQLVHISILLGVHQIIVRVLLLLVVSKVEDISMLPAAPNRLCYHN